MKIIARYVNDPGYSNILEFDNGAKLSLILDPDFGGIQSNIGDHLGQHTMGEIENVIRSLQAFKFMIGQYPASEIEVVWDGRLEYYLYLSPGEILELQSRYPLPYEI